MLARHAQSDDDLRAAAQAFASPGGFGLGGRGGKRDAFSGGAGGASDQGGAGGGGAGGWVHLSDVSILSSSEVGGGVVVWEGDERADGLTD